MTRLTRKARKLTFAMRASGVKLPRFSRSRCSHAPYVMTPTFSWPEHHALEVLVLRTSYGMLGLVLISSCGIGKQTSSPKTPLPL
jgi:hypothetical protein